MQFTTWYDLPIQKSTSPMVDIGGYYYKYFNTGKITPEYYSSVIVVLPVGLKE